MWASILLISGKGPPTRFSLFLSCSFFFLFLLRTNLQYCKLTYDHLKFLSSFSKLETRIPEVAKKDANDQRNASMIFLSFPRSCMETLTSLFGHGESWRTKRLKFLHQFYPPHPYQLECRFFFFFCFYANIFHNSHSLLF